MEAKALICDAEQNLFLRPVQLPDPDERSIVVRTLWSGVSVGTEFALIRGKLSWGPYPICTGYQAVGTVEHVGRHVEGFKPGDLVYYRHNRRISLPDGTRVSAVSGTHCSHAVISMDQARPDVEHLPPGVPPDVGSLFVMPAVGLAGVDMAGPRLGEVVLVWGAGPIGLGVVWAAACRGAVVVAADLQEHRLEVARRLGAAITFNPSQQDANNVIQRVAPGGADAVFECTGLPQCIDQVLPLCRQFGTLVFQGNYGKGRVSFEFLSAHGRRLRFLFPCDDGGPPCRRAVLNCMATGALNWAATLTHRVPAREAAEFFAAINAGRVEGLVCAAVDWSQLD